MRTNSYEQIIEWNRRRGEKPRFGLELLSQVEQLRRIFDGRGNSDSTVIEFIPIRLVTILEVFLRETIREIVDSGEPYLSRAEKLTKGMKIDLAFAAHVDQENLSIGDFVAHAVPLSRLESILATLSNLIEDFAQKLKGSFPRWTEEKPDWPLSPIIGDYDSTIGQIKKLLETRNVLAHELPERPVVEDSDIPDFLKAITEFVEACDWVVVAELQGSVARTQIQMNLDAGYELSELEGELDDRMNALRQVAGISREMVDEVQMGWEKFAELEANLIASQVEGGSMHSMVWASAKANLTADRIEQIKRIIDEWMDS
jgi:uncharacterized protein YecT (DUF1311 family)